MTDLGQAIEAFATLKCEGCDFDAEDWTEADTRSKFIDTLLIDCLGWHESDIRRELTECRRRLDYHLSTTRPYVIVEAKRAQERIGTLGGQHFYSVQIKKLTKSHPPIKKHLEQLAGYCHNSSIAFGILTNGRTALVLCCNRTDSVPWRDGNAIVFPDILDDQFDLNVLFNLIGRSAVASGSLQREFLGVKRSVVPPTVLSSLPDPDESAPPNRILDAVNPILETVFTDVLGDEDDELVSECYVRPGESRLRDDSVEGALLDRPPQIHESVVDIGSRSSFDRFEKTILDRLAQRGRGSTIVIIGNLGVGKTMFRKFFFSPSRDGKERVKAVIPFVVDFRRGAPQGEGVSGWIVSELRTTLNLVDSEDRSCHVHEVPYIPLSTPNALEQIFRTECKQFERAAGPLLSADKAEYARQRTARLTGLLSDNTQFVPRALQYISKSTQYIPCVILDNADHHTAEFQTNAYLVAKGLEQECGCLILLMLQEAWYWHFKQEQSVLSSYHDTVFHIPAPRMRDVLSKRLDFALARVDSLFPKGLVLDLGNNMALEPKNVSKYLGACKHAFFHDDAITTCYECLTDNDIRRGLELFCTFVRAGHQAAETALSAIVAGETLRFSLDEVVCAMACGGFRYYRGARSLVPNLFTQFLTDNDLTYSRVGPYYALRYLAERRTEHSRAGSGYVRKSELLDVLDAIGVPQEDRERCIKSMCAARFLQPSSAMPEEPQQAPLFRASGLGLYVVDTLATTRGYLACVAIDTPIRDARLRGEMAAEVQVPEQQRFAHLHSVATAFSAELRTIENEEWSRLCETGVWQSIRRFIDPT